jgi:hypothetical protein
MSKRTQAAAAVHAATANIPVAATQSRAEAASIVAVDRHRLAETEAQWRAGVAELAALQFETLEQEQWGGAKLKEVQALFNTYEAERTELTKPMNAQLREVNAAFKPVLSALEEAKSVLATKLSDAATARGRLAAAQREAAVLAAQAGDTAGCQQALAAIADDVKVAGVATVWSWDYAVADFAVLSDAFKAVNDKTLKDLCKAFKDKETAPVVPGVTFTRSAKVQPAGGGTR